MAAKPSRQQPKKWGNPFLIGADMTRHQAVAKYRVYVINMIEWGLLDIEELRGKNLGCYCSLDQECHADVLLRLSNI